MRSILVYIIAVLLCNKAIAQDSLFVESGSEKLPNYKFFFRGELHEFPAENAQSLFVLLKYLHQHAGVRNLVIEGGPDQAFLASQYLATGNDSLLNSSGLYLGQVFWRELYAFNKQLPDSQKVSVRGFDFNRYVYTAKAIKYMLKHTPVRINNELNSILQSIVSWDTVAWEMYRQEDFETYMAPLRKYATYNNTEVKAVFGEYYFALEDILLNIAPATPAVKRDEKAMRLFMRALDRIKGNILFNYGISHIYLNGEGSASILESNSHFKGTVCSIYPFYAGKTGSKAVSVINKNLPSDLRTELYRYKGHTLIDLEERKLYPRFKRSQWLLVITE